MNCPACGRTKAGVIKSIDDGESVIRFRKCPCGRRWRTEESVVDKPPLVARKQPLLATNGQRGVGGALSSGPISAVLDPESDRKIDRACVSKKKPRGPVVYDKAFALFWDHAGSTRSKGSKVLAQDVWIREGRPDVVVLMSKWGEYVASCGELFPKDVSRWLGLRGWEEAYGPPRGRPVVPVAPPSPYCLAHQKAPGRPSRYHVGSCPRCRHFEAAGASRVSEPTSLVDVAGAERFRAERERDKK